MYINHNIPAVQTYHSVLNSSDNMNQSIKKLSTGLRINSAADDAAGLAISEKMRAQINGLNRAAANVQDGISLIQTAEGALGETHSILQRMRELSVQAANDTLTQQDRGYIQEEINLLRDEINHIGNNTQFNTKKILNGSASVLWSSDKLSTKAIVNGSMRTVDQFGQIKSAQGNYKINVTAQAGAAEVQKSSVFTRISSENSDIEVEYQSGLISEVQTDNLKPGTEYVITGGDADGSATASGRLEQSNDDMVYTWGDAFFSAASAVQTTEAAVTISALSDTSVTFDIRALVTNSDGTLEDEVTESVTITGSGNYDFSGRTATLTNSLLSGVTLSMDEIGALGDLTGWSVGDTAIYEIGSADGSTGDIFIDVYRDNDVGSSPYDEYIFAASDVIGKDVTLRHYYLDDSGEAQIGSITISIPDTATDTDIIAADGLDDNLDPEITNSLVAFTSAEKSTSSTSQAGVATGKTKLSDVAQFYNSQGVFMLEDPRTIKITQGDGKTASVTLYAGDTLDTVALKFNNAIANDLNQADYVDDTSNFAVFIDKNEVTENTSESVAGTLVIRSILPGEAGKLNFSGSEELINALALNTIQAASETEYTASVADAHTGVNILNGEKFTSNKIIGAIHHNIDVEFDAMAGISASWDDEAKKFVYASQNYNTLLHLADNTTVFQSGANNGETISLNIADMRSHALGLDAVNVMSRETASNAITIIDNAINKVSTQRAELGASQNRLEHALNNINVSAENLSASESRIRDTDMAKEMMNFIKSQILNQAGTSLLTQANQMPQTVLSLIR